MSSVHLSVCLSVTLVYCVEITELIVTQLALDSSLRTLVSGTPNMEHILLGDPLIYRR